MAASFNRTSWALKGEVISTELRAFNNHPGSNIGVTGYGPNINIVKVGAHCRFIHAARGGGKKTVIVQELACLPSC